MKKKLRINHNYRTSIFIHWWYSDIYEDLSEAGAASELQLKILNPRLSRQKSKPSKVSALKRRVANYNRAEIHEKIFSRHRKKSLIVSSNLLLRAQSEVYVRPKELVGNNAKNIFNSSLQISFGLPSQSLKMYNRWYFDVRVASYPYQKYGVMEAVVESISQ